MTCHDLHGEFDVFASSAVLGCRMKRKGDINRRVVPRVTVLFLTGAGLVT